MMRSRLVLSAIGASLLAATTVPAFAVAIKHTSRVGGDPDVSQVATGHAPPPEDTTPAHRFDKLHETGNLH